MKRIQLKIASALTIAAMASPYPLCAGDAVEIPWNQVCRKVAGHEMTVKTTTGETIDGYCISVDVNEVSVNVKGKIIKVARNSVDRVVMIQKRHQLKALAGMMRGGLKFGFGALLTPAGPLALVAIPATLAWGGAAVPFCLLGDLKAKLTADKEITLK